MALILSLKEGQDFYVGDERFLLEEILGENEFVISGQSDSNGKPCKKWTITDAHSREIMPDVFVAAGEMYQSNVASVVVDAPRNILILRGDLHRADPLRKEQAQ